MKLANPSLKICLLGAVMLSWAHGQSLSDALLREKVRIEISNQHVPPLTIGPSGELPKHERVLNLGRQAGFDRAQIQNLLLEFAEEGLLAADPSPGERRPDWEETGNYPQSVRMGQVLAKGAFSALSHIADAAALSRLTIMAEIAPPILKGNAVRAVATTVCRAAPETLPEVARRLTAGQTSTNLYAALSDVLNYPPVAEQDRSRLTTIIIEVFKEGLRNPNLEDRIYLDRVLEQFDPKFRSSEERRRILTELSQSGNESVKKYAEGKLGQFFSSSNSPSKEFVDSATDKKSTPVADVRARGESEKELAAASKPVKPQHRGSTSDLSLTTIAGALLALGAVAWLIWRIVSRR